MRTLGATVTGFTIFIILAALFGAFYIIDERERGVILTNGAVTGVATAGLHFKFPFVQSVYEVPLETMKSQFDEISAYSRDQQPAVIKLSVNYRVKADKVVDIYTNFQYLENFVERVLQPRTYSAFKNVFGQYNAASSIQERARLNKEVEEAVALSLKDEPVLIDSIQIENVDFSNAYEKSVEDRMLAEVEVLKTKQNAEREIIQAQIKVTQAKAEADSVRLRGEAEAAAISARAKALGENPNLVALTQAEKWDGVLPTTMPPLGSVPIVSVK